MRPFPSSIKLALWQTGVEAPLQEWLLLIEIGSGAQVLQCRVIVSVVWNVTGKIVPARLRLEHGRAHDRRKLLLLHFGLQSHHWRRAATSWTWEVIPA